MHSKPVGIETCFNHGYMSCVAHAITKSSPKPKYLWKDLGDLDGLLPLPVIVCRAKAHRELSSRVKRPAQKHPESILMLQ
jgi:hypothetical protein